MENSKKIPCACNKKHSLKKPIAKVSKKMSFVNICSGVLLFLFPKCPICWAAYASIFSFLGLEQVRFNSNWRFLILAIFLIGSFFLLRKHYINKSWLSIILYSLGMFLLFTTFYFNYSQSWLIYLVLILIIMSNLSIRFDHKIKKIFKHFFVIPTS